MSSRQKSRRAPRAFAPDDPSLTVRKAAGPGSELAGATPAGYLGATEPAPPPVERRGFKWGGMLLGAAGSLLALGAGAWFSGLISDLLARQDWLGWIALGLLGLAVLAAFMIAVREAWALLRLTRLGRLRQDAETAERHGDRDLVRQVAGDVRTLYRSRPDLAWARARLSDHDGEFMTARETLTLCERELMVPLDAQAGTLVAVAAKRVSIITAVSPLAVLDMAVVAAQNLRMLRRIATLYGARPGTIGLLRLARMVISHIVLTGGIAMGDDIIQQMIGHRLMAKLSARLGEGLFNGALTARIGLAAIDVCRPLPFIEAEAPRLRTLLTEIARQAVTSPDRKEQT